MILGSHLLKIPVSVTTNSSHTTVTCKAQGGEYYGRGYVNPRLKREVQSRQRVCVVFGSRQVMMY